VKKHKNIKNDLNIESIFENEGFVRRNINDSKKNNLSKKYARGNINLDLNLKIVLLSIGLLIILIFAGFKVGTNLITGAFIGVPSSNFEISFGIDSMGRFISLDFDTLEIKESDITDLKINDNKAKPWYLEDNTLTMYYDWQINKEYNLNLIFNNGSVNIPGIVNTGASFIDFKYGLEGNKLIFDINKQYIVDLNLNALYYRNKKSNKPLYLFYDRNYLSDIALKKSDLLLNKAKLYGLNMTTINLVEFTNLKNHEIVLIYLNPLKNIDSSDGEEKVIYHALPSMLFDLDEDGYTTEESKYGKSLLFDLMKDKGTVFISADSTQPNTNIVFKDGSSSKNYDKKKVLDSVNQLSDLNDVTQLSHYSSGRIKYTPKISQSLELLNDYAFSGVDLEIKNSATSYYPYNYRYFLKDDEEHVNIVPIYLSVGSGGLMFIGDYSNARKLDLDEQVENLFKLIVHGIWDYEWSVDDWERDSEIYHEIPKEIEIDGEFNYIKLVFSYLNLTDKHLKIKN